MIKYRDLKNIPEKWGGSEPLPKVKRILALSIAVVMLIAGVYAFIAGMAYETNVSFENYLKTYDYAKEVKDRPSSFYCGSWIPRRLAEADIGKSNGDIKHRRDENAYCGTWFINFLENENSGEHFLSFVWILLIVFGVILESFQHFSKSWKTTTDLMSAEQREVVEEIRDFIGSRVLVVGLVGEALQEILPFFFKDGRITDIMRYVPHIDGRILFPGMVIFSILYLSLIAFKKFSAEAKVAHRGLSYEDNYAVLATASECIQACWGNNFDRVFDNARRLHLGETRGPNDSAFDQAVSFSARGANVEVMPDYTSDGSAADDLSIYITIVGSAFSATVLMYAKAVGGARRADVDRTWIMTNKEIMQFKGKHALVTWAKMTTRRDIKEGVSGA